MKLKNKLLFILIFFILVFIVSDSKSYASIDVTLDDYSSITLDESKLGLDLSSYNYLCQYNGERYFLCFWDKTSTIVYESSDGSTPFLKVSEGSIFVSETSFEEPLVLNPYHISTNGNGDIYYINPTLPFYSSTDIYNVSGELVFHQPVAVDNQYNLQPILEKTKVGEMATKEMTQVLLVVMKKVAIVIVGLVGLLTGWLLLLKLLKRS